MDGNPRWKLSGESYYLHSNMFGDWVINDYRDGAFGGFYVNRTSSDPTIPPLTGWEIDYMGTSPAPTVGLPGSSISYSVAIFTEYAANDGSIDNSQPISIIHNNYGGNTFTGSNGDNFVTDGKVIVTNLSAGLTADITRTSATTLSVILTGNATTHNDTNDVLNLTFAFQDDAFSSGDASRENNATKNDLEINYFQEYGIGSSGDYASISAALSAFNLFNSDWNILNLAAETFTENNLNISNLTVRGQGAGSTIVQAAASQGIANRGVFITTNTVVLEDLTVRHGKTSLGGGINNKGVLTVNNCNISNNDANIGGGVFNQQPVNSENSLTINNSTIYNNRSISTSYGSAIILYGGDATCTMTNCTVFGNTSSTSGNEGALVGWAPTNIFTIINSTISGNDAGLLSTYGGKFIVQNTIIAGNDSKDYRVLSSGTVTDNGYNIVESQTAFKFNSATDILYSHDYLGNIEGASGLGWNKNDASIGGSLNLSSTLADNSSINGTQTLALSSGSFAIDAGTASGASATDQRGLYTNGSTDIGAYEYGGLNSDPSVTAPIITGPNSETGLTSTVSINENLTAVHTFSANKTVTWSLGNTNDEALLGMDSSGNLVFINAPDYETPSSTVNSNTYVVEVNATDAANNSTTQTLTITVLDIPSTTFGTFAAINKQYFVGTYTIVPPTTNNTSPFVYTSDNTAVATISGSVITFTGLGTANIMAEQAADANYEGNTVSTLLTVLGKDLVSKYGGISSTDVIFVDSNGKVGGAFGVDKYGNIQDIYEDLVTLGLIMHLDAGNTASYSGTGTTWTDLSGNGNHGTLINGVTYNSANSGSLVFDGINDYFVTNSNLNLSDTDKLTVQIILKTATTGTEMIMEHSVNWNSNNAFGVLQNSNKIQFTDHNQGYNVRNSVATINDNKWHLLSATTDRSLNATNQTVIYIDGAAPNSEIVPTLASDNNGNLASHKLYISSRAGLNYFFNGTIAQVFIYNRVLTALEIQQNYNAVKSKYGL
ncbi:beta strand repeat-containing protein [Lunatibacter salilacus]|uniref:beta strand repeat-containing protein n=1 Tax=Lunatibacter salilacus TaxID=2483804 RepID=UPI00131D663C|nr:LamG-like jellyroll fold domain-containing protein [Lunatibacter salilacus]